MSILIGSVTKLAVLAVTAYLKLIPTPIHKVLKNLDYFNQIISHYFKAQKFYQIKFIDIGKPSLINHKILNFPLKLKRVEVFQFSVEVNIYG